MERGLLWLPLLAVFIWLAWAGWNEFQKVEAYRTWAEAFDRAKYDILAVLGQKGSDITWGKPTRQGPVNLQTFSLAQVKGIQVMVGDRAIDIQNPPINSRNVALEFQLPDAKTVRIPFTDLSLATQWGKVLQQDWQRFKPDA
ncbi:MAG TPA: hypothetical protein V6C78_10725 [Crinalium sp.]|jgi:hypothetical protein